MPDSARVSLAAERLRTLLSYDPTTGVFTWRVSVGRVSAGSGAGSLMPRGYWAVKIDGHQHLAHRLAWLYVHGAWPTEIDHRDGDQQNNAIANLREATRSQNRGNSKRPRSNTSGFKGVSFIKRLGQWRVVIARNYLGLFPSKELAARAYRDAAEKYYGEFARHE